MTRRLLATALAAILPPAVRSTDPDSTAVSPRSDTYAPGPIRAATDAEAAAIEAFVARHPEYAKLPAEALVQAMSTYHTDDELEERAKLAGEGVPLDWRPGDPDDGFGDSLGRV